MPKVRFAPTASGNLHLGSLMNALLSHLFARKDGGEFLLRLDRHPHQSSFEQGIIEDLQAFGFESDKIILQRERDARYQEVVCQILEEHADKVYFCDCSVQDITFRGATGSKMEFLHREEKYPSPCDISSIKIFGPEDPGHDLAQRAEVGTTLSARGHGVEHILDGRPETFWRAKDVGYLGEAEPEATFSWQHPHWISDVEITYPSLPLRCFRIQNCQDALIRIEKPGMYYYSQHRPTNITERFSFAPARVQKVILDQFGYFAEVKKEYYYDGFCRNRGLKLPLSDSRTTIRIKNEEAWWLPDVAIWFDGQMDLCLTSAIDDTDYDIGLRVRGVDIKPFALLENEAGKLLQKNMPQSYFHFMLCDSGMVKYSKFIGSPRAAMLLRDFSAAQVLSLLARQARILREPGVFSLPELVQVCDLRYLRDARLPLSLPYHDIYRILRQENS